MQMTTPIEQQIKENVFIIWFFCAFCMDRQEQQYTRDESIYEVYTCLCCRHENRVAVR